MKKVNFIIFCLLTAISVNAQNYRLLNAEGKSITEEKFKECDARGDYWIVKKGEYKGVFNPEKGLIIKCLYEEIRKNETANVFAVKKDGKWGVVDISGENLLELKYDEIKYFSDKIAIVDIDFYWVMIDYEGKTLVNDKYEDVSYSHDKNDNLNIWFKKGSNWELFSRTGEKLSTQPFSFIGEDGRRLKVVSNGWHKSGIIDTKTGKLVVPLQYDKVEVINFNLIKAAKCQIPYDGFGPSPRTDDYLYGIYSVSLQKEVVPCTFDRIMVMKNHIKAIIRHGFPSYYTDKGETINPDQLEQTKGLQPLTGTKEEKKALIESLFWKTEPNATGYYKVKNEKYEIGLINLDQQFIIPFGLHKDLTTLTATTFVIKGSRGYWSIINEEGNLMSERCSEVEIPQSDDTYYPFAFFKTYSFLRVYDLKGKELKGYYFNEIYPLTNQTSSSVTYRIYSIKTGTITDIQLSKDGQFTELDKPVEGENLIVPFKGEDGLFGLKKADGTIVEAAKNSDIKIKGTRNPIFVIYNPSK